MHHRLARALAPAIGRREEVAVRALAHHALGRARAALDQVVRAVGALLATEEVEQPAVDPERVPETRDDRLGRGSAARPA